MRLIGLLILSLCVTAHCFVFSSRASVGHRLVTRRVPLAVASTVTHVIDGVKVHGELRPLHDNVLVKVNEAIAQTAGGIFIPDSAKERPTEGVVLAVGPGKRHKDSGVLLDMDVAVGAHVVYGKYEGTSLKIDGVVHQMIKASNVLFSFREDILQSAEQIELAPNHVLIALPDESETKSESGLFFTASSNNAKPSQGKIVRVAKQGSQLPSGTHLEMCVREGENAKFRDYAGTEVTIGKKKYMVLDASDILATF